MINGPVHHLTANTASLDYGYDSIDPFPPPTRRRSHQQEIFTTTSEGKTLATQNDGHQRRILATRKKQPAEVFKL